MSIEIGPSSSASRKKKSKKDPASWSAQMHVSSLLRDCKTKYLDCYPFAMSKSKSMLGTRELDVSKLVSSLKIFLAIGFLG
jgi:hypothetical protein